MEVKDSMDRFLHQVFPVHPHYLFDFSRSVHTAPSITGTHKPLQHNKRGFDPYKWILTVTFFFLEIPLWILLINRAVIRFILVLHLGISKHVLESDSGLSNTTVAWSDWVFRCSKKWVSARLGANWSTGSVLGLQIKTLHSIFVHFYSGYMENVKQSLSFSTNSLVYDLKWNDNQVSLYWCSTPRASNVLSLGAFLIMFTADSSIVFSEWLALVRVALSFCISGMQALFSKTFKHFLLLTEDEEMDKSSHNNNKHCYGSNPLSAIKQVKCYFTDAATNDLFSIRLNKFVYNLSSLWPHTNSNALFYRKSACWNYIHAGNAITYCATKKVVVLLAN